MTSPEPETKSISPENLGGGKNKDLRTMTTEQSDSPSRLDRPSQGAGERSWHNRYSEACEKLKNAETEYLLTKRAHEDAAARLHFAQNERNNLFNIRIAQVNAKD